VALKAARLRTMSFALPEKEALFLEVYWRKDYGDRIPV